MKKSLWYIETVDFNLVIMTANKFETPCDNEIIIYHHCFSTALCGGIRVAAENRNGVYRGLLFREFQGPLSEGGFTLVGGGALKDFFLPVTGHEGPERE